MRNEHDEKYISYLKRIRDKEDRGALASLRRGLSDPLSTADLYPYVVPFVSHLSQDNEKIYYQVAALFGYHNLKGGSGSLGKAYRRLRSASSDESDPVEKRFVTLLNADKDDLYVHLRHAISIFKTKDIPVDWSELIYDLRYWDHPDRFIQRKWAGDFWGNVKKEEINEENKEK